MKKVAMVNCLKANEVCTGAACMKAWEAKTRSFSVYQNKETVLTAFARCNGCGNTPENSAGLKEKLERLVSEGTQIVHFGVCTKSRDGKECPVITEIGEWLTDHGIEVVRGTH